MITTLNLSPKNVQNNISYLFHWKIQKREFICKVDWVIILITLDGVSNTYMYLEFGPSTENGLANLLKKICISTYCCTYNSTLNNLRIYLQSAFKRTRVVKITLPSYLCRIFQRASFEPFVKAQYMRKNNHFELIQSFSFLFLLRDTNGRRQPNRNSLLKNGCHKQS